MIWIKVSIVLSNGDAVVADDLSGFNSGTIGQRMTTDHLSIDLRIKDYEIQ